jgi:DNA-binding IclR family transcriptional regulator
LTIKLSLLFERSEGLVTLHVDVGSRFPALISATGRCIAAFGNYPWEELAKRFKKLRWDHPPLLENWKAQIERTRALGYALDEGNYLSGVSILAAPVWTNSKSFINTLVILGLKDHMKRIGYKKLGEHLREQASAVSLRFTGLGN